MNKTNEMRKIRDEIVGLVESPLYSYRVENKYFPVIGEGNHDADIVFVGEAPGENEAKRARPFCGAAGRILDELLESISFERSDVYITNIVKDRPPGNRDPSIEEIELYSPFLLRQLEVIQPKVIATLGRYSMKFLLEKFNSEQAQSSISQLHGRVIDVNTGWGELKIVPLYHPAVALYQASRKDILLNDFRVLLNVIG